jgi:hypothetical protein
MMAVATSEHDAELMLRVREGDAQSFALLLAKHRGPVIHFLYRMYSEPGRGRGTGAGGVSPGIPKPGWL